MAFHNDIDAFVFRDAKGRARHSVRAVVCLAKGGAHGMTRPTSLIRAEVVVLCHMTMRPDNSPHPTAVLSSRSYRAKADGPTTAEFFVRRHRAIA
jgi:hypothetical protein